MIIHYVLVTTHFTCFSHWLCVAVVALASLASTAAPTSPKPVDGSAPQDDYKPSVEDATQLPDTYQLYPELPISFELPNVEYNPTPFYSPPPSEFLTAPRENQEPNHYLVPIPAQDLVAPTETEWNPNRDPRFFYEVPAFLTKQDYPTNLFPKKFNKDIHSKDKPFSSKPKQEIVLEPIDAKQYEAKEKELHKVFQQAAKNNNQKLIEAEKVKNDNTAVDEEKGSNRTATKDNESEGVGEVEGAPSDVHDQELDAQLTASLGVPSYAVATGGDRINFHMVGHDGPESYKWGFDTGKG
ncbi:hypothetical protein NQ318_016496 [Aromia moschata]|uniref:Uncharacterized protein n=1 Tax=Aromia moschata TaxID=1265417 RepID=A0AAV8X4J6_9CUCU|nr:hypothetical protein NQ318_016496 [Aromia moschata]